MKKNNKRNASVNLETADVSVSLAESKLLKDMVEELARFRQTPGFDAGESQMGWNSLETSSLEAYVSGDISMMIDGKKVVPPFVASFLFTCTRPQRGKYYLRWMNSLS